MKRLLQVSSLFFAAITAACVKSSGPVTGGYTQKAVAYNSSDKSLLELCGREEQGSKILVGHWRDGADDALQAALIIESPTAVKYSHGHYQKWGIDYSECYHFEARFMDKDTIKVTFRDGRTGTFDVPPVIDEKREATFTSPNGITRGTFTRVK